MESRIKRSRFVICLIGEPYECRGEEMKESACVRGALASGYFGGAGAYQTFMVNLYMETL
jgi:hypothetical protein